MKTWYQEEREQLSLIREGAVSGPYADTPPVRPPDGEKGLADARRQLISFITLASRAAMEGGAEAGWALEAAARLEAQARSASSAEEVALVRSFVQNTFAREVRRVRDVSADVSPDVAACLAYIDAHLESEATLQEAAELIGLSPYYLGRKFKRETGRSFSQALREHRLIRAEALLAETDLDAAEISRRLQFADPSYFGKCYRRRTGHSPGSRRTRS